jgi:hypothetical protein
LPTIATVIVPDGPAGAWLAAGAEDAPGAEDAAGAVVADELQALTISPAETARAAKRDQRLLRSAIQ